MQGFSSVVRKMRKTSYKFQKLYLVVNTVDRVV